MIIIKTRTTTPQDYKIPDWHPAGDSWVEQTLQLWMAVFLEIKIPSRQKILVVV